MRDRHPEARPVASHRAYPLIVTSGGTEDGWQAAHQAHHDPLARREPARLRWSDERGAGVSEAENSAAAGLDGPGRRLVLMRHAKSDWPDVPDHERPLAKRGRK